MPTYRKSASFAPLVLLVRASYLTKPSSVATVSRTFCQSALLHWLMEAFGAYSCETAPPPPIQPESTRPRLALTPNIQAASKALRRMCLSPFAPRKSIRDGNSVINYLPGPLLPNAKLGRLCRMLRLPQVNGLHRRWLNREDG